MTTIPVLGLYFMQTMAIGAVAVALANPPAVTCQFHYLFCDLCDRKPHHATGCLDRGEQ